MVAPMICPRCGVQQPDSPECARCGVVIRKYLERQTEQAAPRREATAAKPQTPAASTAPPATARPTVSNPRLRLPSASTSSRFLRKVGVVLFPPHHSLRQFYGALQRMLRAGAGMDVTANALANQGWGRFGALARGLRSGLKQGLSIADSLTATGLVSRLHVGLLAAGEQLGTLPEMLGVLIAECQARLDFRNQALKASIYPLLLIVLSAFMMPIPTLVLGSGDAYAKEVLGLLARAGAGVATFYLLLRLLPLALGSLLYRLPGSVERFLFPGRRAQALWVLHSAVKAGVPWAQALDLASACFLAKANRSLFDKAYQGLQRGESVVQALAPLVHRSYQVLLLSGEMSGSLEDVFRELHEEYAVRAKRRVAILSTILSALILLGALAYVGRQTMSGLENALTIPSDQLEELNRELKGTGIKLY